MGFCQWAVIVLWALDFIHAFSRDGDQAPDISVERTGTKIFVSFFLLYFGGFFG